MTKQPKNVLITGISTGIGHEAAVAFANAGYTVYGSVRKSDDALQLKEQLGSSFHTLVFDVTDDVAVDLAAEKLTKEIGDDGLACLINNAGIAIGGPLMHVPMQELRQQFEVNVIGLMKVTQAFLPLLGAKPNPPSAPGRIINISSVAGKIGMPFMGAYVGSKHAVEGISESMRRELMLYGIDVIVIGPGAIKTPIWNKGLASTFADTAFAQAIQLFGKKFIGAAVKEALEPAKLARDILHAFEAKQPKVRYSIVPSKFKNSILPRLLPSRVLDKFLAKELGLNRSKSRY